MKLNEIPASIVRHVSQSAGYPEVPHGLPAYDASTARFRHMHSSACRVLVMPKTGSGQARRDQ
ncbi:MAG TPA: hypothetical protein VLN58_00160 [Verrucomicrobiae bacterium]|nr:hypothetical protein [Verrucomicrobiae bacterium]